MFYSESITIYKEEKNMFIRTIAGIILIGGFITLLSYGLNYMQAPSVLENVEKIVFVSEWVRERFFLDIDQKLQTKTEVVYPSVNKQKKIKKEKNIIFVGRLNYSKGYDIFKDAVIKILDNFYTTQTMLLGTLIMR